MIRPANDSDLATICAMLGQLSEQHVGYDRARFVAPADIAAVCAAWLRRATTDGKMLVVLAENEGRAQGYLVAEAFGAEPEYWSGPHVFIHDLYVDASARRRGVARELVESSLDWARRRGIAQVRAGVAVANGFANQFFEAAGFRATLTEMNLDLGRG